VSASLRVAACWLKAGSYEGSGIGKKDLRQMQDHPSQGCGAGDLREFEA
jgi:hypothetical protein